MEGSGIEVTMGSLTIPRFEKFRYLGSMIKGKGNIDDDISFHIRLGW